MAKQRKTLPKFKTEEEELRIWDEHDPSDLVEGPSDVIVRLKRPAKRAVTFRLDEPLYQELKAVAAEHGLPYQRLMRELIRQSLAALKAEEQSRKRKRTAGRRRSRRSRTATKG